MGLRKEAIFINGVYCGVIEAILRVQRQVPEHIMFLQPYAAARIVHLADAPPPVEDRVRLFLSTTEALATVRYTAEIVGWEDKMKLPGPRAKVVSRLICALQPKEGGLYHVGGREQAQSTNLLHVWRMTELRKPFSVAELVLTSTGKHHSPDRTTAGGWPMSGTSIQPISQHSFEWSERFWCIESHSCPRKHCSRPSLATVPDVKIIDQ